MAVVWRNSQSVIEIKLRSGIQCNGLIRIFHSYSPAKNLFWPQSQLYVQLTGQCNQASVTFMDANVRYKYVKWRMDLELDVTNIANVKRYEIFHLTSNLFAVNGYNIRGQDAHLPAQRLIVVKCGERSSTRRNSHLDRRGSSPPTRKGTVISTRGGHLDQREERLSTCILHFMLHSLHTSSDFSLRSVTPVTCSHYFYFGDQSSRPSRERSSRPEGEIETAHATCI